MFKNILVPLDGSFVGETALPYARALAGRTGASLTLVRATQMPVGVGDRSVEYTRLITEAEQYLSAQAADLTARGFAVQTGGARELWLQSAQWWSRTTSRRLKKSYLTAACAVRQAATTPGGVVLHPTRRGRHRRYRLPDVDRRRPLS